MSCPIRIPFLLIDFNNGKWNTSKLWKESLNSDGHQFNKHQQNEQSPLILTKLTEHIKKNHDYDAGSSGPGLGQAQKYGVIKKLS